MGSRTKKQKHIKIESQVSSQLEKSKKAQAQTTRKRTISKDVPVYPQVPPTQISKKPGYDFYMFVNGNWLHSVKVPSFRSAFGVSEELEEKIKDQLSILVEKGISFAKKGKKQKGQYNISLETVGRFGLSALRPSVQNESVKLLKKMLTGLQCMRDTTDVCKTFGEFARLRITGVFTIFTYFEPGKNVTSRLALSSGQLGLPDTSYYFKTAPGKSKTLLAYGKMLDAFGTILEIENLSSVIQTESVLAKCMYESQNDNDLFIKGSSLHSKYNLFNWEAFWEGVLLGNWKANTIKVVYPSWIKSIEKLLTTFTIDQWKLLFTVQLILHAVPLLPPPFDDIHSDFYERRLRGQKKKLPQHELTLRLLQEWLPSTMSRLYLKNYVDPKLKETVTQFTNLIRIAAIDRIQNTEWLDLQTRKKAVEKVKRMRTGVAYPEKMPEFSELNLQTDNLLKNVLLLGEDSTKNDLAKINHTIDIETNWEDAIYAVNAYYYSEVNQIILPVGSLQWPFYHFAAPQGWNFGALGAVIGHEMTHAFDNDGKDYNEYGVEENWWSAHDNLEYGKRTEALVELFNNAKVLGHPVNGVLTLNENISDLGGVAIALDALKLELAMQKALDENTKKTALQNFFIAYAVSWRIKEKQEKVLQGLFLDRHAPAPLRVNLIVSQFDEWYEAFDVKTTDKLYIPPEERIRIF